MNGQELVNLYEELFGQEPIRFPTVSIEDKNYKEMIGYCNLMGTPLTDEIILKFFNNNYDLVNTPKNNFSQFKKTK